MSKFRRQLMTSQYITPTPPAPVLPYDAEVDYIQSSGTQFIDTEIVADLTTEVSFTFTPTFLTTAVISVFGRYGGNNDRFQCIVSNNTPQFGIGSSKTGTSRIYVGTSYDVTMSASQLFAKYNSVRVTGFTASSIVNDTLLICSRGISTDTLISANWQRCTIQKSGALVRDYIPVRVGQAGYFYDKISGRLFGDGDFSVGNDKN